MLEAEIQKFAQQMMANMGQVDASGMCGAPSTDRTAAATCCLAHSHWRIHHQSSESKICKVLEKQLHFCDSRMYEALENGTVALS